MKKYLTLFFLLAVQSCKGANEQNAIRNSNSPENSIALNTDSLNLIRDLYQNVQIIKFSTIGQGFFTHQKNNKTRKIVASVKFPTFDLSYNIVFSDTSNIYSETTFVPSENYKYIDSYIVLGKDTLNFTGGKSFNDSTKIEPINLWYGDDFGIHGKSYKGSSKIIFLRGLNMFCNGNYCTNYKILIIVKGQNGSSAYFINTHALFPYDFENTLLFKTKKDAEPSFFIIKPSLSDINTKSDFQLFSIDENRKIIKKSTQ